MMVLFQDIKDRSIHVILPICILVLCLLVNYNSTNLSLKDIFYNIVFIGINTLGLIIYFSIKTKSFVNPIDQFIGLGDIVFFIAITPLFNLKDFMLFFIVGLIFSLMVHSICILYKSTKTIPLAGYLSLFLAFNILITNIFKINTVSPWM